MEIEIQKILEKHGAVSASYLQRKYKITNLQAKKSIMRYSVKNNIKLKLNKLVYV